MVLLQEVDAANRVQILDKTVCVLHTVNTFGKDMNQTILPAVTSK